MGGAAEGGGGTAVNLSPGRVPSLDTIAREDGGHWRFCGKNIRLVEVSGKLLA